MAVQRVNGKQRTLADVRRANGTEASVKASKKANKAIVEADREVISQALSNPSDKAVKENLIDLKQKVDRSGTPKQRREFSKIFKADLKSDKEMLDWALSEAKNTGDLKSFKAELDAFGTKAQKEKWAELYEKYHVVKQESDAATRLAVENARKKLSGGSDYKAASEALIYRQITSAESEAKALELEKAFGAKAEHVEQVSSYFEKPAAPANTPKTDVTKILNDIEAGKEADYNNPARKMATQIMNPEQHRLFPEVKPKELTAGEIYRTGLKDGAKKAGKTARNNFFMAIIPDINKNINNTLDDKFKKFAEQQKEALNKFEDAASKMDKATGKINGVVGKLDGAASKIDNAAASIGKSAAQIGDAAGKFEGVSNDIKQALETGKKAQKTLSNLKKAGIIGGLLALGMLLGAGLSKLFSKKDKEEINSVIPPQDEENNNNVIPPNDNEDSIVPPVLPNPIPEDEDELKTYCAKGEIIPGEEIVTKAPRAKDFEDWGVFASRYQCLESVDENFSLGKNGNSYSPNSYTRTMMKVMQSITDDNYDLARLQKLTKAAENRNYEVLKSEAGFNYNTFVALRGIRKTNTFAATNQNMPTITTIDENGKKVDVCSPSDALYHIKKQEERGNGVRIDIDDVNNRRQEDDTFSGIITTSDGQELTSTSEAEQNEQIKQLESDGYTKDENC